MSNGKSDYVTWKRLEGGRSVLLDLKSGRYYTLNETGTMVWELTLTHVDIANAASRIGRICSQDPAAIEQDVRDLVNLFTKKGLLGPTPLGIRETSEALAEQEAASQPYVKPVMEEHEAVRELTASGTYVEPTTYTAPTTYYTYTYSSHYWYPN